MKKKLISMAMLPFAGLIVAACQTDADRGGNSDSPGVCRRDAAEALTGMDRLTDERAMQMTGATVVRQIAPGQPVTLDYRQERVTIETDPGTGKIIRAACG